MAAQWLKQNWPNARAVDINWTMERYCYPQNVRDYIINNWVKVSNNGGGTYCEPEYYNSLPNNHPYKIQQVKKDNNSQMYNQMDDINKKALKVAANQGEYALVQHMFKHPDNGRALSYAEMRTFYG